MEAPLVPFFRAKTLAKQSVFGRGPFFDQKSTLCKEQVFTRVFWQIGSTLSFSTQGIDTLVFAWFVMAWLAVGWLIPPWLNLAYPVLLRVRFLEGKEEAANH